MAGSRSLSVLPSTITIKGVEPGGQYSAVVSIKNLDITRSRSVTVKAPTTQWFQVKGTQQTHQLAPGLEITFEVVFDARKIQSGRDYHDTIVVHSDIEDVEVEVHAYQFQPELRIDGDLNFGLVPVDSKPSKALKLINDRSKPAEFKLQWDKSLPITFEPAQGAIGPAASSNSDSNSKSSSNTVEVVARLTTKEMGAVAGELAVLVTGAAQPCRVGIDATIVHQSFELMNINQVAIKKLDFGSLFFGETQRQVIAIFNNGPTEAKFDLSYGNVADMGPAEATGPLGGEGDGGEPYAGYLKVARIRAKARESKESVLRITPFNGVIPPFSKTDLTVVFHPMASDMERGFTAKLPAAEQRAKPYEYVVQVDFGSGSRSLRFPVRGRGAAPALKLEPALLHFGQVNAYEWADQLVEVTNQNAELPAQLMIDKGSPYFYVEPTQLVLPPATATSVLVRYQPKALGKHQASVHFCVVSACSGKTLAEQVCQASGASLHLGQKQPLPGGTEAIPETFTKRRHYVDEGETALWELTQKRGFSRPKLWETAENAYALEGIGPLDQYGVTKETQVARSQHADAYQTYIRTGRTATRQRHLTKKEGGDNDLNLGMKPYRGLSPSRLDLPKTVDALWTVKKSHEAGPATRKPPSPDVIANLPLLKEQPQTAHEHAECSEALSEAELRSLIVGPKVVDFGKVSPALAATQYFVVKNPLGRAIQVVLDLQAVPELSKSAPVSQVIPAGGSAKFPLVLICHEVRALRETVDYCINGFQFQSFNVSADVVPVTVDLSAEELRFRFSLDNWDDFVDQYLVMDNPHTFPVDFEWVPSSAIFTVTPSSGTIPPKSAAEIAVRWQPGSGASSQAQDGHMTLKLKEGAEAPMRVHLHGELPAGVLKFKERELNLGPVPVGVPQTVVVQIKNSGAGDAAYRVLPNGNVSVTPERGPVNAESLTDLEVGFTAATAGPWQAQLEVEVRGGKTLRLNIKAEAVLPDIKLAETCFNFPPTYIGGGSRLPLSITNAAAVPATLVCDLTKQPDLQLLLSRDAWAAAGYEVCPVQKIGANGELTTVGSKRVSRRVSCSDGGGSRPTASKDLGHRFILNLKPNSTLPMTLAFRPSRPMDYRLDLAFVLHYGGSVLSGDANNHNGAAVAVQVTGTGVQPALVLSKSVVDFGSEVVVRSNQPKSPYSQDIYVRNNTEGHIEVSFGAPSTEKSPGGSGVFTVEPKSITLGPDDGVGVCLRFCPKDARTYEAFIPVYLNGDVSKPYLDMEVTGSGRFPKLTFDVQECLLPPVPLGICSHAIFHVLNNGYDNLELRFRLPPDESRLPLALDFPEGNIIGLARDKLPVLVSFTSPRPISFTAIIDFMDEDGKLFSLPVTGTTDNCMLTLQPFLQANLGQLDLSIPAAGPPCLEVTEGGAHTYDLPYNECVGPSACPAGLCRFLSATTTRSGWGPDLRRAMVASKGKLLLEMVELLGGKAVPNRAARPSGNKAQAAQQQLLLYEGVLAHLRSHGALLNPVKPELLLDSVDFGRLMESREAAASGDADLEEALELWQPIIDNFDVYAAQAWNAVLLQIFRVYVLGRVSPQGLRQLPGMSTATAAAASRNSSIGGAPATANPGAMLPPDDVLCSSNIFSTAESCLLSWLSFNIHKAVPAQAEPVTNFEGDLANGVVLFSLLLNHWPGFASRKSKLHLVPSDGKDLRENADLVVKCMQELGLPYEISPNDFEAPDPADMMMLVLYLYQSLPQLVPRGTVDFTCKLNETQVRDVELTNPSRKMISYSARLEGHKDFSLDVNAVKVEPGRSARLSVKCTASTALPRECRLVLMSRKDGGAYAATLVFLCRSKVHTRAPVKRIEVTTPLYELQTTEFVVTNPFPSDCDFAITLLHERAEPLPVEEAPPAKGSRRSQSPAGGSRKNATNKGGSKNATEQVAPPVVFPEAFGVDRHRLRLRAGASEKLKASFLPFKLGEHRATVMFADLDCGEFCYELVGDVGMPAIFLDHKATVGLDGVQSVELTLPFTNHQLEAARRAYADKHPLGKDKEQAQRLRADIGRPDKGERLLEYKVTSSSTLITCPSSLTLKAGGGGVNHGVANGPVDSAGVVRKSDDAAQEPPQQGAAGLKADASSAGSLTAEKSAAGKVVALMKQNSSNQAKGSPRGAGAGGNGGNPNALKLSLKPVGAGIYPTVLQLTSPYDIRVLHVDITAQSMGQTFALEFDCPARQSVMQEIPLVNAGDTTMSVSATLSGKGFSGPRDVVVPPGGTVNYPLTFTPNATGNFAGNLELSIPVTGEKNLYVLSGEAGEPLAEGHVLIECQARTTALKLVKVPNIAAALPLAYSVYCDLDCVVGPDVINMTSTRGDTYKFSVWPPRSGVFMGSLSFVTADGQYAWYSMEIHAAEPPDMGTVEVSCPVRKAVAIDISLNNPLDKPLHLQAIYSDAALVGPPSFVAAPGVPTSFECYYAPLMEGTSSGSIRLVSDEAGEFWWKVQMTATTGGQEQLPLMTAALGRHATTTITVTNPLATEATFTTTSSAPRLFSVSPASMVLAAYDSTEVQLEYRPSSMGVFEEGVITVNGQEAGTVEYICQGQGMMPSDPEPCSISATLGHPTTKALTWTNPFNETATVSVALISNEQSEIFNLLLKEPKRDGSLPSRNGTPPQTGSTGSNKAADKSPRPGGSPTPRRVTVSVAPYATLQLPVSFCPVLLQESAAQLKVSLVSTRPEAAVPLEWHYQICGIAEADSSGVSYKIKCRARQKVAEDITVPLPGLGVIAEDHTFTYELFLPEEHRVALESALTVVQLDLRPMPGQSLPPSAPPPPMPSTSSLSLSSSPLRTATTPSTGTTPGDAAAIAAAQGLHALRFKLCFAPMKALATTAQLAVKRSSGARWVFDVHLTATAPDVDGVLILEAFMGRTTELPLLLYSSTNTPQPFSVTFTPETPLSFDAVPSRGVLPPAPAAGQEPPPPPLKITYTCRDLGKVMAGKVIIQTPDSQHTYEIRGKQPQYVPPSTADIPSKWTQDTASSAAKGRTSIPGATASTSRAGTAGHKGGSGQSASGQRAATAGSSPGHERINYVKENIVAITDQKGLTQSTGAHVGSSSQQRTRPWA